MNAVSLATRAVLGAFARKILRPVEVTAVIVFAVLFALSAYLASAVSGWWWIAIVLVGIYGIVASMLWLALRFILEKIEPNQTIEQKKAVKHFMSKTGNVADMIGMTRFGLALRVMRDVARRNKSSSLITELSTNSKDLKKSFEDVIAVFR